MRNLVMIACPVLAIAMLATQGNSPFVAALFAIGAILAFSK